MKLSCIPELCIAICVILILKSFLIVQSVTLLGLVTTIIVITLFATQHSNHNHYHTKCNQGNKLSDDLIPV